MGVYNLEDGHIERFDDVQSFSLISPPAWVASMVQSHDRGPERSTLVSTYRSRSR